VDNFLPVLERFEALSGINVKYTVFRAENLAPILPAQFAAGAVQGDVIFMWGWWIAEQGEAGHVEIQIQCLGHNTARGQRNLG